MALGGGSPGPAGVAHRFFLPTRTLKRKVEARLTMRWVVSTVMLGLVLPGVAAQTPGIDPIIDPPTGTSVVDLSYVFAPVGGADMEFRAVGLSTQGHIPSGQIQGVPGEDCPGHSMWDLYVSPNDWPLQEDPPYDRLLTTSFQANATFAEHDSDLTWPVVFDGATTGPFSITVSLDLGTDHGQSFDRRVTMATFEAGPLMPGDVGLEVIPHDGQDVHMFSGTLAVAGTDALVGETLRLRVAISSSPCQTPVYPVASLYSHPDLHGAMTMAVVDPIQVERWMMTRLHEWVFVEVHTTDPWGAQDVVFASDPAFRNITYDHPSESRPVPRFTGPLQLNFQDVEGPIRIDLADRQGTVNGSIEVPLAGLERLVCDPLACTATVAPPQNAESPAVPVVWLLLGLVLAVGRRFTSRASPP